MTEDYIDKTQLFLDQLQKLGNQLKAAEDQQKLYLIRMMDLKKEQKTESQEYAELNEKSKSLQAIIDKYRPIYLERMEMVRQVSHLTKRKRTRKK